MRWQHFLHYCRSIQAVLSLAERAQRGIKYLIMSRHQTPGQEMAETVMDVIKHVILVGTAVCVHRRAGYDVKKEIVMDYLMDSN